MKLDDKRWKIQMKYRAAMQQKRSVDHHKEIVILTVILVIVLLVTSIFNIPHLFPDHLIKVEKID
ncbi:hypothetical protein [Thalassobacillus pellis]|uniref:hypothetical protein n=1 Tax=Thalassobacillus pellis TaxID=748008 RepID=UPI001961299B|nr:hypothetical protein [Thalassobacillus pellis]MBM7553501.1 hypothetical protein [Thalassobacillus pellis]